MYYKIFYTSYTLVKFEYKGYNNIKTSIEVNELNNDLIDLKFDLEL